MNSNIFIQILTEKYLKVSAIKLQVDDLIVGELEVFLDNNTGLLDTVSPSQVGKLLLETSINLTNNRLPIQIIKNVYDADAVKFAILISKKSIVSVPALYKKLSKLFYEVIANSNHYAQLIKSSNLKGARTSVIAPKFPIELFWLIPLTTNIPVLLKTDIDSIVKQNCQIAWKLDSTGFPYTQKYDDFNNNIEQFNKEKYKQFLIDSYQKFNNLNNV